MPPITLSQDTTGSIPTGNVESKYPFEKEFSPANAPKRGRSQRNEVWQKSNSLEGIPLSKKLQTRFRAQRKTKIGLEVLKSGGSLRVDFNYLPLLLVFLCEPCRVRACSTCVMSSHGKLLSYRPTHCTATKNNSRS